MSCGHGNNRDIRGPAMQASTRDKHGPITPISLLRFAFGNDVASFGEERGHMR